VFLHRRFVEKKTSEFYKLFDNEISVVKKAFDAMRRSPPKSPILVCDDCVLRVYMPFLPHERPWYTRCNTEW
jgi:hypothetical protein